MNTCLVLFIGAWWIYPWWIYLKTKTALSESQWLTIVPQGGVRNHKSLPNPSLIGCGQTLSCAGPVQAATIAMGSRLHWLYHALRRQHFTALLPVLQLLYSFCSPLPQWFLSLRGEGGINALFRTEPSDLILSTSISHASLNSQLTKRSQD